VTDPDCAGSSETPPRTAAEAQAYLTRRHVCGCQEFWFMDPPKADRCTTHLVTDGPCDSSNEPAYLSLARSLIAESDAAKG
jgi:hypothetical protein